MSLPRQNSQLVDDDGRPTREFYTWMRGLMAQTETAEASVPTVSELSDVAISSLTDGDALVYDNSIGRWVNSAPSGGASPIYANAQRRALQAIGVGAWTAVSFDTEGADSGSMFSLSNPTYIEIPSNGIYTISAFVPWRTATTVISNRGIAICKNAAPASGNLSGVWQAASGDSTAQSCTWTGTLAAGDKIYLYVFTGNGADDIRVNTGYGACFLGVMGFAT